MPISLEDIESPRDLKGLSVPDLETLASQIRTRIIETVSETGGHLASNLGVVELTLALHAVLDSPTDKIIWDVSHQCYTHKL
ncbi:MAG: 1-deoxy-D-xylulose-5-phosphate synthase, partial [Armatimonadia bacterium]|nr:1-deoxy-D-xylulose-5-phosphate synthase [Armatimonadia bacterium]